jgi:hypothetical protein
MATMNIDLMIGTTMGAVGTLNKTDLANACLHQLVIESGADFPSRASREGAISQTAAA